MWFVHHATTQRGRRGEWWDGLTLAGGAFACVAGVRDRVDRVRCCRLGFLGRFHGAAGEGDYGYGGGWRAFDGGFEERREGRVDDGYDSAYCGCRVCLFDPSC